MEKTCSAIVSNNWVHYRCRSKAKYEHEGKPYCGTHYPPKVAERANKRDEKYRTEEELLAATRLMRAYFAVAKDLGVTVHRIKALREDEGCTK